MKKILFKLFIISENSIYVQISRTFALVTQFGWAKISVLADSCLSFCSRNRVAVGLSCST